MSLDIELWSVHAEYDEAVFSIFLKPGADIGKGPNPVDAGEGPELDEHRMSAKGRWRQGLGVQPSGRAVERRELPLNGQ
jgi:hypothetical protein